MPWSEGTFQSKVWGWFQWLPLYLMDHFPRGNSLGAICTVFDTRQKHIYLFPYVLVDFISFIRFCSGTVFRLLELTSSSCLQLSILFWGWNFQWGSFLCIALYCGGVGYWCCHVIELITNCIYCISHFVCWKLSRSFSIGATCIFNK